MGTVLEFSEDVAASFRIDCRDEAGQVATADRGRPKCVSRVRSAALLLRNRHRRPAVLAVQEVRLR